MSVSKLLTPEQVAELLSVTTHTLAVWRCEGRYPLPYIKTGRLVRYREEDVLKFIESRTRGAQEHAA
jgi:excisionase family DNA binding protein